MNMTMNMKATDLDAINEKLRQTLGATAQFGDFQSMTKSFGMTLELEPEEGEEDERIFVIEFRECQFIGGPLFWADARLEARALGENLEVVDPRVDFRVICYRLTLRET